MNSIDNNNRVGGKVDSRIPSNYGRKKKYTNSDAISAIDPDMMRKVVPREKFC